MGAPDTHRLGYRRVDDDPNASVLLATMDATGEWDATRRLREWERDQLRLEHGQRLLDVGCGLGDAALTLAQELGDDGELVGIDASTEMLSAARGRARDATCRVRFSAGDACALEELNDYFDVVRCERTLQWLADPVAAATEMMRVLRPGGRVSLIDSDWSTFTLDVGDVDLTRRVQAAMRTERGRPSNIGDRLHDLVRDCGCELLGRAEATQTWKAWNPDESDAPQGCFSMESLADDLVAADQLELGGRDRFVSTIHQAARRNQFSMALTMYAVVAAAPAS
jgi:SAM-dependent methyltransferase